MAEMKPNRCAICKGYRHPPGPDPEIEDRVFEEPWGEEDPKKTAMIRAYMCRECAIVHWAWKIEELQDASS